MSLVVALYLQNGEDVDADVTQRFGRIDFDALVLEDGDPGVVESAQAEQADQGLCRRSQTSGIGVGFANSRDLASLM